MSEQPPKGRKEKVEKRGRGPAKRGARDPLLEELQQVSNPLKRSETIPAQASSVLDAVPTVFATPTLEDIQPTVTQHEKVIPPELKAIYGDEIPADNDVALWLKLGGEKRAGFEAKLAATVVEATAKRLARERKAAKRASATKSRPAPTKGKIRQLNPDKLLTLSELAYRDIADNVRNVGANLTDLPSEVWGPANTALADLRRLAEEYRNETDAKKRAKIVSQTKRIRLDLGGTICSDVVAAAREYLKDHSIQTINLASVPAVEPNTPAITVDVTPDVDKSEVEAMQTAISNNAAAAQAEMDALVTDKQGADKESGKTDALPAVFRKNKRGAERVHVVRNFTYDSDSTDFYTHDKAHARLEEIYQGKSVPEATFETFLTFQKEIDRATHAGDDEAIAAIGVMNAFLSNLQDAVAARQSRAAEQSENNVIPPGDDATRVERVGFLRGLVGKFDKLTGASERFTRSTDYLLARIDGIDAKAAEKGGGIEGYFRMIGEKYNKLHWGWKLGVGASLGLGAAVSSAISAPTALVLTLGLAGQRMLGMAGIFLKMEKHLQDTAEGTAKDFVSRRGLYKKFATGTKESRKNRAMFASAMLSVGAGYAIKEGVDALSKTEQVHALQDWLVRHYPFGSTTQVRTDALAKSGGGAGQPAPVTGAGDVVPKPPAGIPALSAADQARLEQIRAEKTGIAAEIARKEQMIAAERAKIPGLTEARDAAAKSEGRIVEPVASKVSVPAEISGTTQNADVLPEAAALARARIGELDAEYNNPRASDSVSEQPITQVIGAEGSRSAYFERPVENVASDGSALAATTTAAVQPNVQVTGAEGSRSAYFEQRPVNEAPLPELKVRTGPVVEKVAEIDITSKTTPDNKISLEERIVASPDRVVSTDLTGNQATSTPEALNPESFERFNPKDFNADGQRVGTDGAGTPSQEITQPATAIPDVSPQVAHTPGDQVRPLVSEQARAASGVRLETVTGNTTDNPTQPPPLTGAAPFIEQSAPRVPLPGDLSRGLDVTEVRTSNSLVSNTAVNPASERLDVGNTAEEDRIPGVRTPAQLSPDIVLNSRTAILNDLPDEHDAHQPYTYSTEVVDTQPDATPKATTEPEQSATNIDSQSSQTPEATDASHTSAGNEAQKSEAGSVNEVPNQYGITIPFDKSHVYANPKGELFVFGGSMEARAKLIYEFLEKNPSRIVYDTDASGKERIPWRFISGTADRPGEVIPDKPVRVGFFGGRNPGPPAPDEFAKRVQ